MYAPPIFIYELFRYMPYDDIIIIIIIIIWCRPRPYAYPRDLVYSTRFTLYFVYYILLYIDTISECASGARRINH